jgi:cellulose synthase/poly-beta-1,6-N-acetylglucosamine synthase-like glycosyltransferase
MFSYLYSVKVKTDSTIIIIATTVGGVVFLCIVLIVLLIKYKLRKRAPKVSVNIPLTVETPQQSLPIDQVNYLRMVCLEVIEPPSIYKVKLV